MADDAGSTGGVQAPGSGSGANAEGAGTGAGGSSSAPLHTSPSQDFTDGFNAGADHAAAQAASSATLATPPSTAATPGALSTPVDGPPRINAGATGSADPNDFGEGSAPENPSPLSAAYHQR